MNMADKNLHDIKIDDLDNPKKTPLKNILTLLALLFIILVMSVAITRLILNTDDEGVTENNNSSTALVETDNEKSLENSTLATGAAVVAGAAAGTMLGNGTPLKERNVSTGSSETTSKDSKKDTASEKDKDSGSKTKVTLREHHPVKVKEHVTPKKHTPAPKKHTVVKKAPTHKEYVDKVVSSSKKTASHSRSVEGKKRPGHYIKVGTFKDTSTAVAKIKKTGLNYILVKPKNDKTMTRVLIGPFKSKWGAKQHLPSVQHNIAEGAYITRID
jgi:cell division septation protein DedD